MRIGQTWENEKIRVHMYADSIHVKDLTNAGKRGKSVDAFSVGLHYARDISSRLHDIVDSFNDSTDYAKALGYAAKALAETPEMQFHESKKRGVDVVPPNLKPIVIHTNDLYVKSDIQGFRMKDLQDINEATTINTNRSGAVKAYKWFRENYAELQSMTYKQAVTALHRAGIPAREYYALD